MILELSDGRELRLPDAWSDDQARDFGKAFMRGEIAADRVAELEREADADRSIHELILRELRGIRAVLLADKKLIPDPTTGELTRSRVIVKR